MITKNDIESLIKLAGCQSKQELMACLVDHVQKIAASSTIAVYEVFNTDGNRDPISNPSGFFVQNTSDSVLQAVPLLQNEGFAECIATNRIVRLTLEKPWSLRMIFPIRGANEDAGLLVIDTHSSDAEALYMIEALSEIWRCQQFLLDRNDHDKLTGLLNRQALESRMQHLFREYPGNLHDGGQARKCLAMLDLDKFKDVNDKYGHLFGDEVLVHFTRLMNKSFRPYDSIFRYGGEEFVVVLQNVDLEMSLCILERFRGAVEAYNFPQVGRKTVSIGVIQITASELPSTILDRADKALYYVKEHGRNRVCAYEHLLSSGQLQEGKVSSVDAELF